MIKYEEYELIELFGNVPEEVDEENGFIYSFTIKSFNPQGDFSLTAEISNELDTIAISLFWKQKILFYGFYTNVDEIVKLKDGELVIKQKNSTLITLKDNGGYYSIEEKDDKSEI